MELISMTEEYSRNDSYLYLDLPIQEDDCFKGIYPSSEKSIDKVQSPFQYSDIQKNNERNNGSIRNEGNMRKFFSFLLQPSRSKYAHQIFVFGSELDEEKTRLEHEGPLVIHPCSSFRLCWLLVMVALLIANLTILPLLLTFFSNDLSKNTLAFNCFFDIVFFLDVVITFRTGIIRNQRTPELILSPWLIFLRYTKTWFFLDLMSTIPFDYIYLLSRNDGGFSQLMHAGRALRILRISKMLSLFRLLRVLRLMRYCVMVQKMLSLIGKITSMFNVTLLIIFLTHWFSCLQFFVPMIRRFPQNSWVVQKNILYDPWLYQYMWSFFKTTSNMLTLGYGEYPPKSISEAIVTTFIMVSGAILGAIFLIQFILLFAKEGISQEINTLKMDHFERFSDQYKMNSSLKEKVKYYYFDPVQDSVYGNGMLMEHLPESIRKEIMVYNFEELLRTSAFFEEADKGFLSEVALSLKLEVFFPGDIVTRDGNVGRKMYFIKNGAVDIIDQENKVLSSLSQGSSFGDLSLLSRSIRMASVRAKTKCELYSLDRDSLFSILDSFPKMQYAFEESAKRVLMKVFNDEAWKKKVSLLEGAKTSNTIYNTKPTKYECKFPNIYSRFQDIIKEIKQGRS